MRDEYEIRKLIERTIEETKIYVPVVFEDGQEARTYEGSDYHRNPGHYAYNSRPAFKEYSISTVLSLLVEKLDLKYIIKDPAQDPGLTIPECKNFKEKK